jgi:N-acetylglucosamine kinase-like BadF-type ATPase
VSGQRVIAVDGGASKTDLAVVRDDGVLLAAVRGGGSNPHHIGVDGCVDLIADLYARAVEIAGPDPLPAFAVYVLAGADLPEEVATLQAKFAERVWSAACLVRNDTYGVLRAGTSRDWGVGVVCGAGINAVGVAPDGREVRFPALGPLSGDWGGGLDLGIAAVGAANRDEDGRGPATALGQLIPAHFGMALPSEVAGAVHRKQLDEARLAQLTRVVFTAADAGDAVAGALVDRLAAEVVVLVTSTLARLDLDTADVDVVLGGGLLQAGNPRLDRAIDSGLANLRPRVSTIRTTSPPIVGAALLALDQLGSGAAAEGTLRRQFSGRSWHVRPDEAMTETSGASHG